MQAAAWKEFQDSQFYGKFKGKFDGKAPGIVRALKAHYSKDGGFDGFFNDCCRMEAEDMSEDQILEIMKEKADVYDRKAAAFFKQGMKDLAKAKGIGEKGLASILGSVYIESDDRQKHLMRNYMELMEGGGKKSEINNLVMERYGPNDPGDGSFLKKYGKKVRNWGITAAVAAGLIATCYVSKVGDHKPKPAEPVKITSALPEESKSPCPPKFKKLTYVSKGKQAILPMPEGSVREGLGNDYNVILRGKVQRGEDGVSRVRIRQNVKPQAGVDAIGILSENGWVCGKPGEYITVDLTPGELGNYLSGEGANFQVAALKELPGGVYQSMGSYRNLFVKK